MTREEKYMANHKTIDGITYRKCSKCNEWLQESIDNFYMMNKTKPEKGLCAKCKKCYVKDYMHYRYQDEEHYEKVRQQRLKSAKKPEVNKKHNEATRKWIRDNKEANKKYIKQYWQSNPDKIRKYNENRQHKNHVITKSEWKACKQYFNNACAYCGLSAEQHVCSYRGVEKVYDLHKEHVDHEGSKYLDNCVPACVSCNSTKWKNPMEEWYRQQDCFSEERLQKIYKWINEDYKQYIETIPE